MVRNQTILVVDDDPGVSFLLNEELTEGTAYQVTTYNDSIEAMNALQVKPFDVVLLDVKMPRVNGIEVLKFIREQQPSTQVIMLSSYADVKTAIEATKLGAYDFVSKPYNRDELLATVKRALEHRRLMIDNELMKHELTRRVGKKEIIAHSPIMKSLVATAKKIANSDSIVHISGPSGTGKELFAHLIHDESPRKDLPFVALNCASIPDSLLESELFGHEKGAFTNAYQMKQGLVEVSNGGTLFLDEVGDISPTIQPKLLRFLETGEYRRVGGTNTMRVDVRIISATNKDLNEEVKAGRFRQDLLYRLNVVSIHLPPLKERKEDIPLLIEYFIASKQKKIKHVKKISEGALQRLLQYDWPGNIRELEHTIEGAMILSHDRDIDPNDLILSSSHNERRNEKVEKINSSLSLEELEKIHIEHTLKRLKFNRVKTASLLGITPKTLYLKIKKYKIITPEE